MTKAIIALIFIFFLGSFSFNKFDENLEKHTQKSPSKNHFKKRILLNSENRSKKLVKMQITGPDIFLGDETILERIDNELPNIVRASIFPSDREISSIDQAYLHLKKTTPIPQNWFPTWGYEIENYYVFSGNPILEPETAFLMSFLVSKENGASWRYGPVPHH